MAIPNLIVVTGPAGSGKTTLAHEVARRLGCPVISRDEIREGLVASHPGFRPTPGDALMLPAYETFFATLQVLLAAEVTLVAEAAFQHKLWAPGLQRITAAAALRVVRCQVAAEVAADRMRRRMGEQPTRAAHHDAAHLAAGAAFEPIHLDSPTLDVDTGSGYRPGLADIVAFARRR